jgi:hypothetical protein
MLPSIRQPPSRQERPVSLTTQTGKEFQTAEEALDYIRACGNKMLDPGASHMDSMLATTELLYTVKALDDYLVRSGSLPYSWRNAFNPFVAPAGPRDVLDMS